MFPRDFVFAKRLPDGSLAKMRRPLFGDLVREIAVGNGAFDAVAATHYAHGGAGATDLGRAVLRAREHATPTLDRACCAPTASTQ